MDIFAFEVWPVGSEHRHVMNARSADAARYEYVLEVRDCWPDVKYTDIQSRKLGPAHTSEALMRTARYRGMPNLRCGEAVIVDGLPGVVVGHNDSANFDVLFESAGIGNVHPSELKGLSGPAKLSN